MLILLPILVGVLFYSFVSFDRLVKAQHQLHRDSWISDGKPSGFFWRAKESDLILSQFARLKLSLVWLFHTPSWAVDSRDLIGMLKHLRYAVLVWNVGILSWFYVLKLLTFE